MPLRSNTRQAASDAAKQLRLLRPALLYDFAKPWTLTVPQQPPAPSTTGKLVA